MLAWVLIVYGIIQGLDGNVLVPLLFSEANDLHPITIILAILVFGGLWGFWGVFFAIPLATLVKAIYNAWPRQELELAAAASATSATPRRSPRGAASWSPKRACDPRDGSSTMARVFTVLFWNKAAEPC
jgi:hypothetical protein